MTNMRQIEWDEKAGAAANARRHLPRLMADYFVVVRGILEKDPAADKLHQVRLASKRVRYTLELFRPCYGPGLEARLAELRRIQQSLGEVNDAVAARRLLSKAAPARSPQSRRIQIFLEKRAAGNARKFRREWLKVFDAPGQFAWWTGYLARSGRAPRQGP
jgi:CHAD domain-containing protein